jgi:hypothetical protein
MDPITLTTMLTPVIVFVVTWAVTKIKTGLPGWVITSLLVPAFSALVAYISTTITGQATWLLQFVMGFLSVFINEFLKQINLKA